MPKKNLDGKGRWRSLTIAFRVSPEENEEINRRVRLSGLTKQDYITRRCQERDIVVVGNPRVYKALKEQMGLILAELKKLAPGESLNPDLADTIRLVVNTLGGMNTESLGSIPNEMKEGADKHETV